MNQSKRLAQTRMYSLLPGDRALDTMMSEEALGPAFAKTWTTKR